MMLKTCGIAGWIIDSPAAALVKVASRGLRGHDLACLVKRAGAASAAVIEALKTADLADGEEAVHLIAAGDHPHWGNNRNGDGFDKNACGSYHGTFVKHAKWFRHHDHKATSPSYGRVVKSAYDRGSGLVHLIAGLNATKAAAARNGGFVADEELDALDRGEDIPVSMGCKVAYDECQACGNKAPTRKEYCGADSCPAGGCKTKLARVVKVGNDLVHLGVNNPHPTWFDISKVGRPAAPYAHGTRADWLDKTAADLFGHGALARSVFFRDDTGVKTAAVNCEFNEDPAPVVLALHRTLVKVAAAYRYLPPIAAAFAVPSPVRLDGLAFGQDRVATKIACAALCRRNVLLPLAKFAALTGRGALVREAEAAEPDDETVAAKIAAARYAPLFDRHEGLGQGIAAAQAAAAYSLDPTAVAVRAAIAGEIGVAPLATGKLASAGPDAVDLAADYAAYRAYALAGMAETLGPKFPAACELAVLQTAVAH